MMRNASVVFLRGANVGAHNRFQPALLAKELSKFGVVNIGAVGTFVVREKVVDARLQAEILRKLPFKPEVMICRAQEILDLVGKDPFKEQPLSPDMRGFVSVMAKRPSVSLRLPLYRPNVDNWEVKVIQVSGKFALSLWQRLQKNVLYPNEVVEKHFGVPATTRSWNTILRIRTILNSE